MSKNNRCALPRSRRCPIRFPRFLFRSSSITRDAARRSRAIASLSAPLSRPTPLVVDSGSGDDTVEVAQRSGARVVDHAVSRASAAQKQFAVEQATHDWVLCLDADERVSPRARAHRSARVFARGDPRTPRVSHARGATASSAAGWRTAKAIPTGRRACSTGAARAGATTWCTSTCVVDGHVGAARRRPAARFGRIARPLRRQAEPLHDAAGGRRCTRGPQRRRSRLVALAPLARFLRFYVLRLGFLDGAAGLRAHRHRRVRELPQVRQAARARARRVANAASMRRAGRRGRCACSSPARPVHRHARGARAARRAPTSRQIRHGDHGVMEATTRNPGLKGTTSSLFHVQIQSVSSSRFQWSCPRKINPSATPASNSRGRSPTSVRRETPGLRAETGTPRDVGECVEDKPALTCESMVERDVGGYGNRLVHRRKRIPPARPNPQNDEGPRSPGALRGTRFAYGVVVDSVNVSVLP